MARCDHQAVRSPSEPIRDINGPNKPLNCVWLHNPKRLVFKQSLVKIYARFGFRPYKVEAWDDRYVPKDWDYEKNDRPNIYYMVYAGDTRDEAEVRKRYEDEHYPELVPEDYPPGYDESRRML